MSNTELTKPVVVISQPMLFPWVGMFEQIQLSNVFVHYDDVQYTRGSFFNRVQVKTLKDPFIKWMTIPVINVNGLQSNINEMTLDVFTDWRSSHLVMLKQTYAKAPYFKDMLKIVSGVYALPFNNLADIAIESIESVCRYYGLDQGRTFSRSSNLNIPGKSTERVLKVVQHYQGKTYVTGHGAINYFDHELLENNGINIEYMNYQKRPYPQAHGPFTPYITILDLIANCGPAGKEMICSGAINRKVFQEQQQLSKAG
jgi:hypothetical protein